MKLGILSGLLLTTITATFAADLTATTNSPARKPSIFDIFKPQPKTNTNPGGQVISKPATTNTTSATTTTIPAPTSGDQIISARSTNTPALHNLSTDQISAGLKEAIGLGLTRAIQTLGRTNGFLTNLNVRIPIPPNLAKIETSLRKLGQTNLADQFITTLNRAAEQAVPAATEVFIDALKQLTLADAQTLLLSTNTAAATDYFRRTTTNTLTAKFLPIVQHATTNAGVTRAYKDLLDQAPLLTKLFGATNLDIDQYVTAKTLDGLFLMIAAEEKRIRENPQARLTTLLQKVFGILKPQPTPH
jgi:hypothetical protein